VGSQRVITRASREVVPYFLDFEFDDNGHDVIPISMGLVCGDERHLYLEFLFDEARVARNPWVSQHVVPLLKWPKSERVTMAGARMKILRFVRTHPKAQFWGYFADYDWYLFCRIFGGLMHLPDHIGHLCLDLQQFFMHLDSPAHVKPPMPEQQHNALADARWNWEFYKAMMQLFNGRMSAGTI